MPSRPGPASAPGPDRGPAGRRPRSRSAGVRRTTLVGATAAPTPTPSRAKLTGRAAVLLLVVLVLAVSYASSARAWLKQRSDIAALHAEIAQRRAAVADLEQTQRRWHDPAYIEAQARLRFGWVMPGETGYRVIDADGNLVSNGSTQLSEPTTAGAPDTSQWWQDEWATVVEAGKDPSVDVTAKKPVRAPAERIGGRARHGKTSAR